MSTRTCAVLCFTALQLLPCAARAEGAAPPPVAAIAGVLPLDLERALGDADPRRLLASDGHGALWALAAVEVEVREDLPALVFVHGLGGSPVEFQHLASRLADAPVKQYVFVYDSLGKRARGSVRELSAALAHLAHTSPGRDLVVVAHSMGGLVARGALVDLAAHAPAALGAFPRVRLVAVDTPWHGYAGPSDRGPDRARLAIMRVFLPDGMEDLRARSDFFLGEPGSPDPARRDGLYRAALPEHVEIIPVFAEHGADVHDWTEGPIAELPAKLVELYKRDEPIAGSARLLNFFRALSTSAQYFAFQDRLRNLAGEGRLDEDAVRDELSRHFRRFPGDHTGILRDPSARSFGRWLAASLGAETRLAARLDETADTRLD